MQRLQNYALPVLLLIAALALKLLEPRVLEDFRLSVFDTYQRLAPRAYEPAPVRVVAIDDAALATVGQWPWRRSDLARLVTSLRDHDAAVIAFDLILSEPDRSSPIAFMSELAGTPGFEDLAVRVARLPDNDLRLAQAMAGGTVVLGFALGNTGPQAAPLGLGAIPVAGTNPPPEVPVFATALTNLPQLEAAAASQGSLNALPEPDGVIRRVPLVLRLDDRLLPSLSAEALRLYGNRNGSDAQSLSVRAKPTGIDAVRIAGRTIPTDRAGRLWSYDTGRQAARTISAADILSGEVESDLIADHIVLIGMTATGSVDWRPTPLETVVPGVTIHAQALEQMLLGSFLIRPVWAQGMEIVYIAVLGMVLILLLPRLGPLLCAAIGLFATAAAVTGSWFAFSELRLLLDPVGPSLAVLAVYLGSTLLGYMRAENERSAVRSAFGRYVSPELVERLTADRSQLHLGGEERTLTLMFCDIRGFTALSEQRSPEALTSLLNRFFTPMTDIVLRTQGTIDKYIGDCIMAFWNAPVADPDHAAHACRAALQMRTALAALNGELAAAATAAGSPVEALAVGIGVNTGPALVGNMGSEQRFDYSALGDAVNLASRLEGQCKTYGVDIIVSHHTQALAPDFAALELDRLRVRGRTMPVRIFTLLGDAEAAAASAFQDLAARHSAMLTAYRARRFDEAQAHLSACRDMPAAAPLAALYALYEARIATYLSDPPGEDWDGTTVATNK